VHAIDMVYLGADFVGMTISVVPAQVPGRS